MSIIHSEIQTSLGFDKSPSKTRVVVAMSGGVDSSVVAASLAMYGYDVVGITLQLYDHGAALTKKGACCAGTDIHDARRIAERLGFPHYVLNYEDIFSERVISEFADSYLAGSTPIPCIRCNERVKFKDLLETAKDLDADCMATGHYIQRKIGSGGVELHSAIDAHRDQSYFLFTTTLAQLEFLRFPLGTVSSKDTTRQLAQSLGLSVAEKPDSQDICFVPNGSYASIIEKLIPTASEPGNIVDTGGQVIGTHKGIIHYTVGQRRGLDLGGLKEPLYVIRLNADTRTIVVGPKEMLRTKVISVSDVNWLGDTPFQDTNEWQVSVKVRSTSLPQDALIRPVSGSEADVELMVCESGVAKGQACVFYETNGTRVLGGGWIRSTDSDF
ncbi:MAG: tRNA 2-thiouridine(34) synthase MnmA [Aestuariivita sp.]|nr:tRNA 2-thiouridine(34) synthase MnmA [Aestuariivita sp.]